MPVFPARLRQLLEELPNALLLALLTAAVTIILALLLSLVLGTENAEHRISSRCFAHQATDLLREIVLADEVLRERIDLTQYPPIDVTGIDCSMIYEPLAPEDIP